jgi:ankyrin repeat protein
MITTNLSKRLYILLASLALISATNAGTEFEDLLIASAKIGDTEGVSYALSNNASIKYRDEMGFTALMYMVYMGHETAATLHINSYNESIHYTTPSKVSVLMHAAHRCSPSFVSFLIAKGANVRHTDMFGNNAATFAKAARKEENLEVLLDHGALLPARSSSSNS